jgi:hypothetical protein
MNTTPSTTNAGSLGGYTVFGNKAPLKASNNISLCILRRGGKIFTQSVLDSFKNSDADEIIHIDGLWSKGGNRNETEALALRNKDIRFIQSKDPRTIGELINLGIHEARRDLVLFVWDDMKTAPAKFTEKLVHRMLSSASIVSSPILQNTNGDVIPSLSVPAFHGRKLQVLKLAPRADRVLSLYPADFCGFYAKSRFQLLGGFDPLIRSPYWQLLDFGYRSYLWGERILTTTGFRVQYLDNPWEEIRTPNKDYIRFYLKNLALRFTGDSCELPFSRALKAWITFGLRPSVYSEIKKVREWVHNNRFRFKEDARSITETWEVEA